MLNFFFDNFAKKHETGISNGKQEILSSLLTRTLLTHTLCVYHHCATFAVATYGPRLKQDTGQPRCPSGSVSLELVSDTIAGRHDFELEKRQCTWAEEPPSYRTINCSGSTGLL